MCENHKHLGTISKQNYGNTNFVAELEMIDSTKKNLEIKRGEIVKNLQQEVAQLFLYTDELRKKLGKIDAEIPTLENKSEAQLLDLLDTLKKEYDELWETIIDQEKANTIGEEAPQKIINEINSEETQQDKSDIVNHGDAKQKKKSFFKRLFKKK